MDAWTLVRFVHLASLAFFVGGQLLLLVAVVPAVRRHGTEAATRDVARRFGIGSAVALAALIATGVAMASQYSSWDDGVLHAKLGALGVVAALIAVHVVRLRTRGLSLALVAASLVVVWLGAELAHG